MLSLLALCGFKHGEMGHQIGENRHSGLTQDEIAEQLGVIERSAKIAHLTKKSNSNNYTLKKVARQKSPTYF